MKVRIQKRNGKKAQKQVKQICINTVINGNQYFKATSANLTLLLAMADAIAGEWLQLQIDGTLTASGKKIGTTVIEVMVDGVWHDVSPVQLELHALVASKLASLSDTIIEGFVQSGPIAGFTMPSMSGHVLGLESVSWFDRQYNTTEHKNLMEANMHLNEMLVPD
jgi:hypothetical protein